MLLRVRKYSVELLQEFLDRKHIRILYVIYSGVDSTYYRPRKASVSVLNAFPFCPNSSAVNVQFGFQQASELRKTRLVVARKLV